MVSHKLVDRPFAHSTGLRPKGLIIFGGFEMKNFKEMVYKNLYAKANKPKPDFLDLDKRRR